MVTNRRFRGVILTTAGIMVLCAGATRAADGSPALPKAPGEKADIILQPVAQTPDLGGTAVFSVGVVGEVLGYQWIHDGAPVIGAEGSTFEITGVTLAHNGLYWCRISTPLGFIESEKVILTIMQLVTFADPNLEEAVREAIGKPVGDIYTADFVGYSFLDASYRNIASLSGLEHWIGLTDLVIWGNQISDLGPLAGLSQLDQLRLGQNLIADLAPLAGLTGLTRLDLDGNQIADFSALAGLTGLTRLSLGGNQIVDISVLSGLTGLTYLDLYFNHIGNIAPLSGLTGLMYLFLGANQIVDISALSGLTGLAHLYLFENQIVDISALSGLTGLMHLHLSANQIVDISVLSGLTGLTRLDLDGNQIADFSALAGLAGLTYLGLGGNQIADISALSGLTGLTNLDLRENQIANISALAGLTGLTTLYLGANQIGDISPLSGLTGLTSLDLRQNQVADIGPLSTLSELVVLYLDDNQISDLGPLVSNPELAAGDSVGLYGNPLNAQSWDDVQTLRGRGVNVLLEDPLFLEQPQAQTVNEGDPVTFGLLVVGTGPFSYLWLRNGEPVGDDSASLTIASATPADAGYYWCRVTNPTGVSDSQPVELTVIVTNIEEVVVDTLSDVADGDTSSTGALQIAPGADGVISLREAIAAANNTPGPNTITFAVSGSITLTAELPSLIDGTGGTWIDGGDQIVLDGAAAIPGLFLFSAENTLTGLTIINMGGTGVSIIGDGATGNVVQNCRIGTDGVTALGNAQCGVFIGGGAHGNLIGGTGPGEGNVLSGNAVDGIQIAGESGPEGNTIQGNLIGTDSSGTAAIPNTYGIRILEGADGNQVGGTTPEARNVISGNNVYGIGLGAFGESVTGNVLEGNHIGPDAYGDATLDNGGAGVLIAGPLAFGNTIGGRAPGAGNLIAANGEHGVQVVESGAANNSILRNVIFGHTAAGIALINGANAGINAPTILGVNPISGIAPANSEVEIFADEDDEGQYYLGTAEADSGGNFSLAFDLSAYRGKNLTATATDASGNTSQFSAPVQVTGLVITTQPLDTTVGEGDTLTLTVAAASPFPPISYQWYKEADAKNWLPLADGGNVSGALTDTLTVTNVQLWDSGPYQCAVQDAYDEIISDTAYVNVIPIPSYTVFTQMEGGSTGAVILDPSNSPGRPEGEYFEGTTVSASITYDSGAEVFLGWTLNGVDAGATTIIDFLVVQDITLTASFEPVIVTGYTLTVGSTLGGSVTAIPDPDRPGGEYTPGTVVSLTATASPGFEFTGWTGPNAGDLISGSFAPVNNIVMDGDKMLQANFAVNTFIITPTAGANGQISPNTPQPVILGGDMTFTITPSSGFSVASVLVDGSNVGAVAQYTFNNVTDHHTIHATFVQTACNLAVAAVAGGTVALSPPQPAQGYAPGTQVTLTATATEGWLFDRWTFGILSDIYNPVVTLSMETNQWVQPNFVPALVLDSAEPSVLPAGYSVPLTLHGVFPVLTARSVAQAAAVYEVMVGGQAAAFRDGGGGVAITAWDGEQPNQAFVTAPGLSTPGMKNLTIRDLEHPINGTWLEAQIEVRGVAALTAQIQGSSTASIALSPASGAGLPAGAYLTGTVVQALLTYDAGRETLTRWRLNGINLGTVNPITVTVSGPATLEAVLGPAGYALTTVVSGNGRIIANPAPGLAQNHYLPNTQVTVTAEALAANWRFDHWEGAVSGTQNPATLRMTQPQTVHAVFTYLGEENRVSGQVVDWLTNRPLEEIQVYAYHAESGALLESAQTAADGTFVLMIQNPATPLRLTFFKGGYDPAERVNLFAPAVLRVGLIAALPDPPAGLEALAGASSILVRWEPSPYYDVAGYNVYRSRARNGSYTLLNGVIPVSDVRYVDATVTVGAAYYYKVTVVDLEGHESAPAGPVEVISGQVTMVLPYVAEQAGAWVRIPVGVINAAGISPTLMQFHLLYPSELVTGPIGVEPTALTADVTFVAEVLEPGRLLITGDAPDGMNPLVGEGHLFDVVLQLRSDVATVGGADQCGATALQFADYDDNGTLRPGVSLFDAAQDESIMVDYGEPGALCVSADCKWADLDYDKSILEADAWVALAISVKLVVPDECQLWAGDLNVDRHINSADAILIQRLAQGIPQNPTEPGAETLPRILPEQGTVTVSAAKVEAHPGDLATVQVQISNPAGLAAAELLINLPPELSMESMALGALAQDFDLKLNTNTDGTVYAALRSKTGRALPPQKAGNLLILKLRVDKFATPETRLPVALGAATLKGEYGDNFAWYVTVLKESGGVDVIAVPKDDPICGCSKSAARWPRPDELFLGVLTMLVFMASAASIRPGRR
jgi:internalin A